MRHIFVSMLLCVAVQAQAITLLGISSPTNSATIDIVLTDIVDNPTVFSLGNKIIIDLFDTDTALSRIVNVANKDITQVNVVTSGDRTRIVITLPRPATGTASVLGKVVTLDVKYEPITEITFTRTPDDLFTDATAAIAAKEYVNAIELLNSLLLMSANQYTQQAQLMIADCYEQTGKLEHAKAEFSSYLTLYPNSSDYTAIQQRLIALEIAIPPRSEPKFAFLERDRFHGTEYKGSASISTYYYVTSSGPTLQDTKKDDESLLTNTRLTGTYKSDDLQTKINVRYSLSNNLLNSARDKENLAVAWVETQDTFKNISLRAGRQSTGYGVLGRFDGLTLSQLGSNYKLIAVAGVPYLSGSNTQRKFYSLGAEYDANDLSGTVYYNESLADGVSERRAIGTELRYFKNNQSVMMLAEYDILYQSLNSMLIQGNFALEKTSPYILIDKRKSPVLYAERAIYLGAGTLANRPFSSVGDTFANSGASADAIYNYIRESTPYATTMVVGTTTRLTDKWVLGTDVQITNTATAEASAIPNLDLPIPLLKQDGTGNSYTYNGILYGTDIYTKGNMVTGILSYTTDDMSTMYAVTGVDSFPLGSSRVELLGKYFIRSQPNVTMTSLFGSIRITAKISDRSSLDSALTITKNRMLESGTETFTHMFYFGYRADF
jgi:tetratricopeptide (TPR) repeat protein